MYVEYPKALYLGGWGNLESYRRVANAEEEAAARAEGYMTLAEFPHPSVTAPAPFLAAPPAPAYTGPVVAPHVPPAAAPQIDAAGAVEIPAGWRDLPFLKLRLLAVRLGAPPNAKKPDVVACIAAKAG